MIGRNIQQKLQLLTVHRVSPFNWHHAVTLALTFDLLQTVMLKIAGQPVLTLLALFHSVWHTIWIITAYFIIWTGITFQILNLDLLVQKDFSISVQGQSCSRSGTTILRIRLYVFYFLLDFLDPPLDVRFTIVRYMYTVCQNDTFTAGPLEFPPLYDTHTMIAVVKPPYLYHPCINVRRSVCDVTHRQPEVPLFYCRVTLHCQCYMCTIVSQMIEWPYLG